MGRNKKYITEEEIKQANRDKAMRYYWKNAELIKGMARIRYKRKKKIMEKNNE